MKLHAGSQARDEPYCQDHGGDNPSPALMNRLDFAKRAPNRQRLGYRGGSAGSLSIGEQGAGFQA